jgi:N6-L-threonylcarbamoyladenine synthase
MCTILAIETSCDDTSCAILQSGRILSNVISSQEIHKKYGGVVPELASRAHQNYINDVVHKALSYSDVKITDIDAVAYTQGPGLLGSLIVGSSFAKGLALSLNKPIITVNHLDAHIFSHFIEEPFPAFPFLCLLVSGGHTENVLINSFTEYKVIGKTKDDAAGEAFDKAAKMLGLSYPGGPLIDKFAKNGNENAIEFNMPKPDEFNYSFSGLKTQLLYFLQKHLKENNSFIEENLADICASYQFTIINYLIKNLFKAAKEYKVKNIGIAGGVAANSLLREMISEKSNKLGMNYYIPKFEYCTDNAAMIAKVAEIKYLNKEFSNFSEVPYSRNKVY